MNISLLCKLSMRRELSLRCSTHTNRVRHSITPTAMRKLRDHLSYGYFPSTTRPSRPPVSSPTAVFAVCGQAANLRGREGGDVRLLSQPVNQFLRGKSLPPCGIYVEGGGACRCPLLLRDALYREVISEFIVLPNHPLPEEP